MFKIINEELFSLPAIAVAAVLLAFGLSNLNPFLLAFLILFFVVLCLLIFVGFKIILPGIWVSEGKYEGCIHICNRNVESRFSLIRLLAAKRIINYYKIYAAYCFLKLHEIEKAGALLSGMEDADVLLIQRIQLRIIRAFTEINNGNYGKALEHITTINTSGLSQKHLPELFYLLSLCYIELGIESDRALKYSEMALSFRGYDADIRLNSACAIYVMDKDSNAALGRLSDILKEEQSLSLAGRARLYYYLARIERELQNEKGSLRYRNILHTDFPTSPYAKKSE